MSVSGGIAGDSIVASSSDLLHENGQRADKSDRHQAPRPQLRPDYPCQNLHVTEPTCPPRSAMICRAQNSTLTLCRAGEDAQTPGLFSLS
jgi:hypothetical protein